MNLDEKFDQRRVFRIWLPLAATWLMMSLEGLLIAALVARLPGATVNLAAYGVAFAFALIWEAPIIMMLSASTALCRDREAFSDLRRFTWQLNLLLTVLLLAWVASPFYEVVARQAMNLEPEVARLSRWALLVFLPWPAAIGVRRFYQGVMIRHGQTRRLAYGTAVRLLAMGASAWLLFDQPVPGALIGAASLSVAVIVEAVVTRVMARGAVGSVLDTPRTGDRLTFSRILHFYIPLLVSSVIALAIHPLVNLLLGHSREALESLATYPVVAALSFVFRSLGLAYQEVAIALMDGTRERFSVLLRFALWLGLAVSLAQGLISMTPLAGVWFDRIGGLSSHLVGMSVPAFQLLILMPLLSVLLSFCRGLLVWAHETRAITWAGAIETLAVLGLLWLLIEPANMIGVIASSWAITIARIADLGVLYLWCAPLVRRLRRGAAAPRTEAAGAELRSQA